MNNSDKRFCVKCGRYATYSVISGRKQFVIRGKTLEYEKVSAICDECGEEIYVPEINDTNVASRKEAYSCYI